VLYDGPPEKLHVITLYTKPNCPHCEAAKDYLLRHDFGFQVVDVMSEPDAFAFITARGHTSVPQLYVGDRLLVQGGNAELQRLTPDELVQKLKNRALPQSS
jgi:glutaredoxin